LRSRPTSDLRAYDLYLRALSELSTYAEQSLRRAEELLRDAVQRDPMYADAWAGLATIAIGLRVGGFISNDEASRLATEAAHRAVRADPQNPAALASAAAALSTFGIDVEDAIEFADRAIALAPYSTFVLTYCGFTYNRYGQFERALELLHEARRLSPRDPRGWHVGNQITMSHVFLRQFDLAIEWARRTLSQHARFPVTMRFLAVALVHSDRVDEARQVISTLLEVQPNANIRQAASFWWRHPWMGELVLDGLRKAGLPE
jgi:adenylate cyclase